MTKKSINIILIIVVLSLWGTAGYRYLSNFFTSDTLKAVNSHKTDIKFKDVKRDTFLLQPLAIDPFLHDAYAIPKPPVMHIKTTTINFKTRNTEKTLKSVISWPDIHYYGFIQSQNKNQVVLVKIDDKLFKMHKGEIINGIYIKEMFKDSISLVFNKERKVFKHI
ncbi:hypothetical protein FMM05_02520 [Flavobacterium zepuense]|uniref:Type II secretion system protein GspC N-terminal domain-containing protein n=1 Tax=Flavobacterium zepuense TaxID=2593302 RepID=A0A552VAM7_9FLAO|nr:hypothetical protein [Flavobacterium zepuense]TRW27533.1 hypothetical protein FMM05_02520 [Flavobacterium zepuense]